MMDENKPTNITVINPDTTIARELIAPSTSPISIAFVVPIACDEHPIANPFAIGCVTLHISSNLTAIIFQIIPVMIMAATPTET